MKRARHSLGASFALLVVAAAPAAHAQRGGNVAIDTANDPVFELVDRLDLEKYKATIKGLTQFRDRRQRTDRSRAAVVWSEAQLKRHGCTPTESRTYHSATLQRGGGGGGGCVRGPARPPGSVVGV